MQRVQARTSDLQWHQGKYIVSEPNYLWSLDGYLKLVHYGIEIYAVWIYVGVSARTSVSVLKQYLNTVQDLQHMLLILRLDQGTETPLCTDAHLHLRRTHSYEPDLLFNSCYLYGTSTANQRIEVWWAQLSKGGVYAWRVCTLL